MGILAGQERAYHHVQSGDTLMPDGAHSHCASSEDMAVLVVLVMLMDDT